MTADLLAVLREAREALRSCAWSTELRTDDALMAMATADAKIGEATMMLTVSALSTPEPQGWRPIDEAPKDGTEMFVVGELGWHAADAVTAYFDDRGRGCWRDKHGDRLEWEPEYFHTLNLPEPPK